MTENLQPATNWGVLNDMAIHFQVLDWNHPCLPQITAALASLADKHCAEQVNLSSCRVIVQTREAGRRIQMALSTAASDMGKVLFPPAFQLPEQWIHGDAERSEIATPGQMTLAWAEVLKNISPGRYPSLFGNGTSLETAEQRFSWSRVLMETQTLLGENLLTFKDAVDSNRLPDTEMDRWRALKELEVQFIQVLESWQLRLMTTVRLASLDAMRPEPSVDHLVLALITDPIPAVRTYLDRLAEHSDSPEIHVLSWGPDEPEAFDRWGRPEKDYWLGQNPPTPRLDECFHSLPNVREEALQVVGLATPNLANPGAVSIGVQKGEVIHELKRNIAVFDPRGKPLSSTSLFFLLSQVREWLRHSRFSTIIQILRHPLVSNHLSHSIDGFELARVLRTLDDLQQNHLPDTVADAEQSAGAIPLLRPVFSQFRAWKRSLETKPFSRSLHAWLDTLAASFPDNRHLQEEWNFWVELMPDASGAVNMTDPPTMEAFLGSLLMILENESFYPETNRSGIRIQGWLELALDEAPHLILSECADEYLPGEIGAQSFLPDGLRQVLGLRHAQTRQTRDAWLLSCIERSRSHGGRVDYTLSRINSRGEPLKPSRLFFLGDPKDQPKRVLEAFRPPQAMEEEPPWTRAWRLVPPAPDTRKKDWKKKLSVTAFRDYLACPFRFYLKHGLKMESFQWDKMEWDPLEFGTLAHNALESFARDPKLSRSDDPETIAGALTGFVEQNVRSRYGKSLPLTLEIQQESLIQRLRAWAFHESESRRRGWEILPEGVEWKPSPGDLQFHLKSVFISGMVDRIERHADTGELRILDFKTRENAISPWRAHLKLQKPLKDPAGAAPPWAQFTHDGKTYAWIDLQLPLYAWMMERAYPGIPCQVGYAHLPKSAGNTGIEIWEDFYGSGIPEAALQCAEICVDRILREVFWPPREKVEFDDFQELFFESPVEDVDPVHLNTEELPGP